MQFLFLQRFLQLVKLGRDSRVAPLLHSVPIACQKRAKLRLDQRARQTAAGRRRDSEGGQRVGH